MAKSFERSPGLPTPPPPPEKKSEAGESGEKLPRLEARLYAVETTRLTEDLPIDPDRAQAGISVPLEKPEKNTEFLVRTDDSVEGRGSLSGINNKAEVRELALQIVNLYIRDGQKIRDLVLTPDIEPDRLEELHQKDWRYKLKQYGLQYRALTAQEQGDLVKFLEMESRRTIDQQLKEIEARIRKPKKPLPPPPPPQK